MKVAVAGGSGFIGRHLIRRCLEQGHDVLLISRSKQGKLKWNIPVMTWGEMEQNPERLEGFDTIVNLAGETINQWWTDKAKERILHSRIDAARRIAAAVVRLEQKPKAVVNASGMSAYGTSETDTYDETSPPRVTDFLSGVVQKWEEAIDEIPCERVVKVRVGLVLGNDGGAFPKMRLPYLLFGGGRIGSGRQWMSWIHIEDMVRVLEFCMENRSIRGPVNATAPHPVTNDEFGRALACSLGRPHYFHIPAWAFRMLLGELSDLVLKGQKVLPKVLMDNGFQFLYPTIEEALRQLNEKSGREG